MKDNRAKKWFGMFLAALLLLQLSYHTLHVLTAHTADSHIGHTHHDTQVDRASFVCELCAKLLGQTGYILLFTALLSVVALAYPVTTGKEPLLTSRPLVVYLLRGPPTTLY